MIVIETTTFLRRKLYPAKCSCGCKVKANAEEIKTASVYGNDSVPNVDYSVQCPECLDRIYFYNLSDKDKKRIKSLQEE